MTTLIESPPTLTPAATSAAPIPARASLSAALESEVWKMVGVRAYRAIAGLTIAVGGGASFLVARLVTDEEITVANVFGFSAVFTAVFAAVAGILAYTAESEHGTIMQTISAQPRRSVVIVAKAAAVAAFGAAIGLAGLGAGAVGAVLGGVEAGDTATMPATIGWAIAFTTLSALLGLGIGAIARHGAAAISGLLVWWLVVEHWSSCSWMPAIRGSCRSWPATACSASSTRANKSPSTSRRVRWSSPATPWPLSPLARSSCTGLIRERSVQVTMAIQIISTTVLVNWAKSMIAVCFANTCAVSPR